MGNIMKIGDVELSNNLVLAPMAGVTDLPFRTLAVEKGAGLVVSEMVSAKGLVMGGERTRFLLASSPLERPLAVQLFGSEPAVMAEAARIVEEQGADMVDINMGCPVKKVVKDGSGSALLRNLKGVEKIISAVKRSINIPLTIKTRAGWDTSSIVAAEVLKVAEGCGVNALAVHARTKSQGFGGRADWSLIGSLKERSGIPIIGNGDVRSPEDSMRMMEMTGCDGVMIGRGAMGNPWIFGQALSYGKEGYYDDPSLDEKRETILNHLGLTLDFYGNTKGVRLFRKHLAWYAKGMKGSSSFRNRINYAATPEEVKTLASDFFSHLGRHEEGKSENREVFAESAVCPA